MKNIYKGMATAALLATTSFANAGTVSLPHGISFNELSSVDADHGVGTFNNTLKFAQWWEAADGTVTSLDTMFGGSVDPTDYTLNGLGEVVLGSDLGEFNCNGCEMTFSFSGLGLAFEDIDLPGRDGLVQTQIAIFMSTGFFTLAEATAAAESIYPLTITAPTLDLTAARMKIFVDYTDTDLSVSDAVDTGPAKSFLGAAEDGSPWLELTFNEVSLSPLAEVTNADGSFNDGAFGLSASTTSFGMNADTGVAAPGFINAEDIKYDSAGIKMFADIVGFGLTSVFASTADLYSGQSAGTVTGFAVTEPTSVAIFGLGLLGFAAASRRKKS
jgi:hypothetical protein